MYYTGTGLRLDNQEAARWVRMAAKQGYAPAQLDLGYLYEQGRGVALDYSAAYMWYKAAADRGAKAADAQLKKLSGLLTRAQVKQASEAAAKLTGTLPTFDLGTGVTSVGGLMQGP
jgi:TPR repeat protein